MKQSIQVVMLPTEEATSLWDCGSDLCFDDKATLESVDSIWKSQHLYITVSQDIEKPKEGNYVYNELSGIGKLIKIIHTDYIIDYGKGNVSEDLKNIVKIICTTDPKLTSMVDYHGEPTDNVTKQCYNGLPQVQQSSLKEYVTNPNGEWEVEYGLSSCKCLSCDRSIATTCEYTYKCDIQIIKKLKLNQDNTVNITSVEERVYSREEVKILTQSSFEQGYGYSDEIQISKKHPEDCEYTFDNWIEENL